jgi:hypothetical protein
MAEDVTTTVSPHRGRFLFVYGLLGGVVVVAIALVVMYAGKSIHPAAKWSAWKPGGGGLGAAKEIADDVGQSYKLPNGDQLADVIAKEPSVPGQGGASVPIHYFAIQTSKGDATYPVSASNSVMYSLCGLGANCAIASGKPSLARGTLVRREILELALYTFKYVPGVNTVVGFMPPRNAKAAPFAILLQKSNLDSELKVPLSQTLASKTPMPAAIPAREVQVVNATTNSRIYTYGVAQTQTGDIVLVFKPYPAA